MSKRDYGNGNASMSNETEFAKRFKDDLIRDEPLDADDGNDLALDDTGDSVSMVGNETATAGGDMAGAGMGNGSTISSLQPGSSAGSLAAAGSASTTATTTHAMQQQPGPFAMPAIDSFANIFRTMSTRNTFGLANGAGPSESILETEQLRNLNDKLAPVVTPDVNEELLHKISESLTTDLPYILPNRKGIQCWKILTAIRSPALVLDESDPNFKMILNAYQKMMNTYEQVEKHLDNGDSLPEDLEIEMHVNAGVFFKGLLLTSSEIQIKHLRPMLTGPNFIFFETCSKTLIHLLKTSMHFRLNENFNRAKEADRRNPLFKMDGWGIVLVKPRQKTFFELQEDCYAYMTDVFRSLCVQRIEEGNPERMIGSQVFFNLVHRKSVPSIQAFDNNRLKKIDKDLQLCHVSVSDAFLQPGRNSNQLFLIVVLYINYFLTGRGNV